MKVCACHGLFLLLTIACCDGQERTNVGKYIMRNGMKDACMIEFDTLKDQAECLQAVIESYYGFDFTAYCPYFPHLLSHYECTGCPWDRVNRTTVYPNLREEEDPNRVNIFHPPTASCTVADYVEMYSTYDSVYHLIKAFGVSGALLVLLSTSVFSVSNRPMIFGFQMSNACFFFTMWATFNTGFLLLTASEDYFRVCEPYVSVILLEIFDEISYVTMVSISLWRCLHLETLDRDVLVPSSSTVQTQMLPHGQSTIYASPNVSSYSLTVNEPYAAGISPSTPASELHRSLHDAYSPFGTTTSNVHMALMRSSCALSWYRFAAVDDVTRTWKTTIAKLLCYFVPVAMALVYILELANVIHPGDRTAEDNICVQGIFRNYLYGSLQYSKIVLELYAVVLYAFGPPKNRALFFVRYVGFILVLCVSVALAVVTSNNEMYRPYSTSMLIPRIADNHVATHFCELTHASLIAILGLFEPMRLGWPKSSTYKD